MSTLYNEREGRGHDSELSAACVSGRLNCTDHHITEALPPFRCGAQTPREMTTLAERACALGSNRLMCISLRAGHAFCCVPIHCFYRAELLERTSCFLQQDVAPPGQTPAVIAPSSGVAPISATHAHSAHSEQTKKHRRNLSRVGASPSSVEGICGARTKAARGAGLDRQRDAVGSRWLSVMAKA